MGQLVTNMFKLPSLNSKCYLNFLRYTVDSVYEAHDIEIKRRKGDRGPFFFTPVPLYSFEAMSQEFLTGIKLVVEDDTEPHASTFLVLALFICIGFPSLLATRE